MKETRIPESDQAEAQNPAPPSTPADLAKALQPAAAIDTTKLANSATTTNRVKEAVSGPPGVQAPTRPPLAVMFTYHPPKGDQPERYERIRTAVRLAAENIVRMTPASREQALALTKLQEASMWANAAIACNE